MAKGVSWPLVYSLLSFSCCPWKKRWSPSSTSYMSSSILLSPLKEDHFFSCVRTSTQIILLPIFLLVREEDCCDCCSCSSSSLSVPPHLSLFPALNQNKPCYIRYPVVYCTLSDFGRIQRLSVTAIEGVVYEISVWVKGEMKVWHTSSSFLCRLKNVMQ